jgi:hypothetical protein
MSIKSDGWREQVEREALEAGFDPEIAKWIADQCGSPETAAADLSNARDVYRACKVLGAVRLAPLAIRSRMPLHRVDAVLMNALPRSGPVRDRMTIQLAGIEQAKLAFMAASIYANQRGAR